MSSKTNLLKFFKFEKIKCMDKEMSIMGNMDNNKNNDRKVDISIIPRQGSSKANPPFPWAITYFVFLFYIMIFLLPARLEASYDLGINTDVEVRGNYAYVAVTGTATGQSSGLRVIDISDPESPEIVGGLNYSNSGILCLTVDGDLAYLAYSGVEGVKIIDISDPEDPEIIGTIKSVYATEIVISNDFAYIADPELGLVIVDVSDPDSPIRVTRLNLEGRLVDIAVQGDFAYLTFQTDALEYGLYVCDISDHENPFLENALVVATPLDSNVGSGGLLKIRLIGDYAYLLKQSVIIIVDLSDPENPTKEKIWYLPGLPPYGHIPTIKDMAESGGYIYLVGSGLEGQQKLFVADISDPLDPEEVGNVSTYASSKARAVSVEENYACIVGDEGFLIIDISVSDDPSVIGKIKSTRSSSETSGSDVYGFPKYYPMAYSQPGYGYGWNQPSYGWSQPSYDWNMPYNYGWNQASYSWSQPSYGWNQPSYGWGQPSYGWNQPYFGYQQQSFNPYWYQPYNGYGGGYPSISPSWPPIGMAYNPLSGSFYIPGQDNPGEYPWGY